MLSCSTLLGTQAISDADRWRSAAHDETGEQGYLKLSRRCSARACSAEHGASRQSRVFSRVLSDLGNARLHAIDAAFLDTILNYELIIYTTCETGPNYFLKFAIDQITSAAPAQKDAGGTVEEYTADARAVMTIDVGLA